MVYKTVELTDGRLATLDWLKPDDLPEIMKAYNDVVREGIYLVETNEMPNSEEEYKWFEQKEKEGILYLVARVNGKVVGGASLDPRTGKSAHVAGFGIFISKDYRNLGLGTRMTKELREIAREKGFEVIRLVVFDTNKIAFHVYQKCGFKVVGRLTNDIKFPDGTYTDRIQMELLLKS